MASDPDFSLSKKTFVKKEESMGLSVPSSLVDHSADQIVKQTVKNVRNPDPEIDVEQVLGRKLIIPHKTQTIEEALQQVRVHHVENDAPVIIKSIKNQGSNTIIDHLITLAARLLKMIEVFLTGKPEPQIFAPPTFKQPAKRTETVEEELSIAERWEKKWFSITKSNAAKRTNR